MLKQSGVGRLRRCGSLGTTSWYLFCHLSQLPIQPQPNHTPRADPNHFSGKPIPAKPRDRMAYSPQASRDF